MCLWCPWYVCVGMSKGSAMLVEVCEEALWRQGVKQAASSGQVRLERSLGEKF